MFDTSQGNGSIVRKRVWVQEDFGLSLQALLHVHHTLVLEACVVEVKVPGNEGRNHICQKVVSRICAPPEERKTRLCRASPVAPFEGTAVLGVVVQLGHPLLEQVSHLTALQVGQGQLVLSGDKRLVEEHMEIKKVPQRLHSVQQKQKGGFV